MARRSIDIRRTISDLRTHLAGHLNLDKEAVAHVLACFDHALARALLDVVTGQPTEQPNPPAARKTRKRRTTTIAPAPKAEAAAGA